MNSNVFTYTRMEMGIDSREMVYILLMYALLMYACEVALKRGKIISITKDNFYTTVGQ